MTVQNPPLWIDGGTYTPELDRTLIRGLWAKRGVVGPLDLLVHQTTVAGLSLEVDGGLAVIDGSTTYQGRYLCENRGVQTIGPLAPGNATNPRKDRIIARVDETANDWDIEVVQGTPAAVPAEPSLPADCIELALLDVPANDSTFSGSQITDRRWTANKGLANVRGSVIITTGGVRPSTTDMVLTEGQPLFDQSENRAYRWNGSVWVGTAAYDNIPDQYYEFGPFSANVGAGFINDLSVSSALVAPYPLRMHIEASGNGGFGATGVCRGLIRITDYAITVVYGKGGTIGGGAPGEVAIDVSATFLASWHSYGYVDVAAGGTCSFRIQHACQTGSNFYLGGVAKVSFEPLIA